MYMVQCWREPASLVSAEPLHPPQDRRARPGALRAWARPDHGPGRAVAARGERLAVGWQPGQIEVEVGQAQPVTEDASAYA